mgnify:CR=1 FL=1
MSQKEQSTDMLENRINKLEKEVLQIRRVIDVLRSSLLRERVSEYDNTWTSWESCAWRI